MIWLITALLIVALVGCTFMYVPGDDASISVDKTGTDVDTETDIETKEDEDDNTKR